MPFRLVLWTVGALLAGASRVSSRVRSQLARDLTLVMRSADGVARSYRVRGRRVSSGPGVDDGATCTVTFRTAAIGTRIFLAPDAIGRIIGGLESGEVECDGDLAIVLWFYELTMGLVPGSRRRQPAFPDAYVEHDPHSKAANRITREPPVAALDPALAGAAAQREKLELWRVGCGDARSGRVVDHRNVVTVPGNEPEPAQ